MKIETFYQYSQLNITFAYIHTGAWLYSEWQTISNVKFIMRYLISKTRCYSLVKMPDIKATTKCITARRVCCCRRACTSTIYHWRHYFDAPFNGVNIYSGTSIWIGHECKISQFHSNEIIKEHFLPIYIL